jgi:hypothetical protein
MLYKLDKNRPIQDKIISVNGGKFTQVCSILHVALLLI